MIHWQSQQDWPSIYFMSVNFDMFSFQTAIWRKKWNDQNVLRLPLNNSPICIFVQTVLKLMISLKKGNEIHNLTNNHLFQIVHCGNNWQSRTFSWRLLLRINRAHQKLPCHSLFKTWQWNVTASCDTCRINILSKFQLPSSSGLGLALFERYLN